VKQHLLLQISCLHQEDIPQQLLNPEGTASDPVEVALFLARIPHSQQTAMQGHTQYPLLEPVNHFIRQHPSIQVI
jgi:hypothetical protein